MIGYVIIKYFDITGDGDYKIIETKRSTVEGGTHIFHPKEYEGYINIPHPEPPLINPDACDDNWEPPVLENIPFGSQRITIDEKRRIAYIKFYYEKVKE